jgi:hypothetical protein
MSWRHSRKRAPRRLPTQRLRVGLPPARHTPQRSTPAEVQTRSVQVVERAIMAPVDRTPADQVQAEVTPADPAQVEATPAEQVPAVAIGRQREGIVRGRAETTRTGPEQAGTTVREQAETTRTGPEQAGTTVREQAETMQIGRERIIGATVARMPIVRVARTQTIAAEPRAIVISRQVPETLH